MFFLTLSWDVLKDATKNIVDECISILDCDRATLFTLDKVTDELVLMVAEVGGNAKTHIYSHQLLKCMYPDHNHHSL